MKALYSNIMRLILTIGLSERDLFVDKVSKIISEKMDADPQRSEHIAESLLRMAESLKDELLLRQLFAQTRDAEPSLSRCYSPSAGLTFFSLSFCP